MDFIDRIIDVENDRLRRAFEAFAELRVSSARATRMRSATFGMFSKREIVGWEHRSWPVSGRREQASLKAGS